MDRDNRVGTQRGRVSHRQQEIVSRGCGAKVSGGFGIGTKVSMRTVQPEAEGLTEPKGGQGHD